MVAGHIKGEIVGGLQSAAQTRVTVWVGRGVAHRGRIVMGAGLLDSQYRCAVRGHCTVEVCTLREPSELGSGMVVSPRWLALECLVLQISS